MDTSNFHPDLQNIQQEFQTRLEQQGKSLSPDAEKEVLREIISEKFKATPQDDQASNKDDQDQKKDEKPKQAPVPTTKKNGVSEEYQVAVDSLIQTAFAQGLVKAVQAARDSHNAFLIDAFHDELIDKFYQEIKNLNK